MPEATEGFGRHVAGMDPSELLADEKTSDAFERNLEILGEAAARLPQE
jgi:uncharacterized protein with HEPN domain